MSESQFEDNEDQARRAIIYLAWGERYLDLAQESAESAAFMDIPAVLLTDEKTAKTLPSEHAFALVKVIEISDTDQIFKTRLWEFLPDDYDSFLFLDVDTTILMDIRFGFEMAETHGIAAAPASHYCLDQFWGFGELMDAAGVSRFGQYQYNTGVIFFSRRPDVERVFREWSRLAHVLTEQTGWKRVDQPFFTLAMEKLGFNPYALSPGYNYRALAGEPISGEVRIWHSFHQPPPNLNEFDSSWPRSGYLGGARTPLFEISPENLRKSGTLIASPVQTD